MQFAGRASVASLERGPGRDPVRFHDFESGWSRSVSAVVGRDSEQQLPHCSAIFSPRSSVPVAAIAPNDDRRFCRLPDAGAPEQSVENLLDNKKPRYFGGFLKLPTSFSIGC
jgi:hypothetical protein